MACFKNEQGITAISGQKRIALYCPMGKDYYTADITVDFVPGEIIMDYCELDNYLNNQSGLSLIIEDLIEKIYNHLQEEYKPKALSVSVKAYSNTHLNVEVTKCSEGAR